MMEILMNAKQLEKVANKNAIQDHLKELNQTDGISVLKSFVYELPKRERKIILLKFWENMIHDEIARAMRLNLTQVNAILENAISLLRKMMISRLVDLEPELEIEETTALVG